MDNKKVTTHRFHRSLDTTSTGFDRANNFTEITDLLFPETVTLGDTATVEVSYSYGFIQGKVQPRDSRDGSL